jgi:hypothetical protein
MRAIYKDGIDWKLHPERMDGFAGDNPETFAFAQRIGP